MPNHETHDDPYRPDANIEERTDHTIGALLADPDAVRRYRTVQALQSGRLREVQAISLRQLEIEHGSASAAADAVGISRQSGGELLAKADASTAELIRDTPAYRYGAYLAVVWTIAKSLPAGPLRDTADRRWYELEAKAPQTLTLLPTITETAMRWLQKLRTGKRKAAADNRSRELDAASGAIADWVASRKANPRLTNEEQFAVYVGLSVCRTKWREEHLPA